MYLNTVFKYKVFKYCPSLPMGRDGSVLPMGRDGSVLPMGRDESVLPMGRDGSVLPIWIIAYCQHFTKHSSLRLETSKLNRVTVKIVVYI